MDIASVLFFSGYRPVSNAMRYQIDVSVFGGDARVKEEEWEY